MMLYERGLLRLEHEVSRYLPEFKNIKVWDGGDVENYSVRDPSQPILIRDLLTHTRYDLWIYAGSSRHKTL